MLHIAHALAVYALGLDAAHLMRDVLRLMLAFSYWCSSYCVHHIKKRLIPIVGFLWRLLYIVFLGVSFGPSPPNQSPPRGRFSTYPTSEPIG